ncbi:MAG: hypothetical protein GTO02_05495, partial [Candidatus Dadabacteria bacterium]|nr:hypothetical protein [Candidatus Dadabacteria bacterium]
MVVGKRFAWGHIGRTGGDAIHTYFSFFKKELNLTMDSTDSPTKHDSFSKRGIDDKAKILVLNIRRLPYYILSRIHFRNLMRPELPKPNIVDDVIFNDFRLQD